MRKGTATVAVIIPPSFGQDAGRAFFGPQQKPEIAVLFDPSHTAERAMVTGILTGDVMQAVSKEMFTGQTGREMVKDSLAQVEQRPDLPDADKKPLEDMLRSVDRWNQQSGQDGIGGLSRGFDACPYHARGGSHRATEHAIQRLRSRLRRNGGAVRPVPGDRRRHRIAAAAAARFVEAIPGGALIARSLARQPRRQCSHPGVLRGAGELPVRPAGFRRAGGGQHAWISGRERRLRSDDSGIRHVGRQRSAKHRRPRAASQFSPR